MSDHLGSLSERIKHMLQGVVANWFPVMCERNNSVFLSLELFSAEMYVPLLRLCYMPTSLSRIFHLSGQKRLNLTWKIQVSIK